MAAATILDFVIVRRNGKAACGTSTLATH